MSFLDPFKQVFNIVDQLVEDKDKAAELKHNLAKGIQEIYLTELGTKTVPWVDAIHKMGRQLTSYLGYGLAFYMVQQGYDPMAAMAAVAPGGIYAAFKHKGK